MSVPVLRDHSGGAKELRTEGTFKPVRLKALLILFVDWFRDHTCGNPASNLSTKRWFVVLRCDAVLWFNQQIFFLARWPGSAFHRCGKTRRNITAFTPASSRIKCIYDKRQAALMTSGRHLDRVRSDSVLLIVFFFFFCSTHFAERSWRPAAQTN